MTSCPIIVSDLVLIARSVNKEGVRHNQQKYAFPPISKNAYLFQHSHLGTGLGFGLEYFPSKSLVCDTDLDQLWNPGSVVFNSAFSTFPCHNSFGAFGRVDGNQWRNVCHGNDCLLSA